MSPSQRKKDDELWPIGPAPWAVALMAVALVLVAAAIVIALAG